MPLDANILTRLAAIRLPARAYQEVLSIIADLQSSLDAEAAEAKRKDQERRDRNAERMRTVRAQKPHGANTVQRTGDAQTAHCASLVSSAPSSFLSSLPTDKSIQNKDSLCLEEPLFSTDSPLKLQQERSESVAPARGRKKGTPLPFDWQPNDRHFEQAIALRQTQAWMSERATDMRIWAGQKSPAPLKADWDLAFSGWMRREASKPKGNGNGYTPRFGSREERQEITSRLLRSFDPRPDPDDGFASEVPDAETVGLLPFAKPA